MARKLLGSLADPIQFRTQATSIQCSVGIATFPRDALDPDDLVKKADTAMYHA